MIDFKSLPFQYFTVFVSSYLLTKLFCTLNCLVSFGGGLVVLSALAWYVTKYIRRTYYHETISSFKKAVFVTGCDNDGGFGNRIALRLNNHGFTVYAGCLNPANDGPQKLIQKSVFPKAMRPVQIDVTKEDSVQRAFEEVKAGIEKDGEELWALINNAGVFSLGHVEWGDTEEYVKVMDVNAFGVLRVTKAFMPLMRKSRGRVVNTASIAGRIPYPHVTAYCMSKHAVVALSDCLRAEVAAFGVKVSTIEPEIYLTPMANQDALERLQKRIWESTPESVRKAYGDKYFELMSSRLGKKGGRDNPEEVADAMLDAVIAVEPETRYKCCGVHTALVWKAIEFLPFDLTEYLKTKSMKRKGQVLKPAEAVN